MTLRRRILGSVLLAVALGALVVAPIGSQREISIELWLGAVAGWLAFLLTLQVLRDAPPSTSDLRALVRWQRPERPRQTRHPRELLALEGTLISARDNSRAYELRLRPRLQQVVEHHLSVHHGVDAATNPTAAAEILGESAWLLSPSEGRTPTLDEVECLLDRVAPTPTLNT